LLAGAFLTVCVSFAFSVRQFTRDSIPKTKQFLVRVGDVLERHATARLRHRIDSSSPTPLRPLAQQYRDRNRSVCHDYPLVIISSGLHCLRSRICHLVSLRRSLTELYVGANPRVDDNFVTPLLMLSKLSRLSLVDTGVSLQGLRRFAISVDEAGRAYPRVHVSHEWMKYLKSEHLDPDQITRSRFLYLIAAFPGTQVWKKLTNWRFGHHSSMIHRSAGGFPSPYSKSTCRYMLGMMQRRWRKQMGRIWYLGWRTFC